jgi:glycosyltransferase involved in cell wall biosynthesis
VTCCALVLRPPSPAAIALVAALGVRIHVLPLGLVGALPALGRALLGDPRPLQVLLYWRAQARRGIERLLASGGFDVVHAQLLRSADYLPHPGGPPVVVDLVDALSLNLDRRARLERGPVGKLAAWEARRVARAEQALLARAAAGLVVSETERRALGGGERVRVVPNGVDLESFPLRGARPPGARVLFAGNLGYFPNVDAACWLADEIFPRIRAAEPGADLRLVGARPARAVRRRARRPGVAVAGQVLAMAPELAAAAVAVIPMRAGSGLQNKVLEALAVGTPVVSTTRAVAGLEARNAEHLLVADEAADIAAAAVTLLRDPQLAEALARAGRALVEQRYRWEDSAAAVEASWNAAVR